MAETKKGKKPARKKLSRFEKFIHKVMDFFTGVDSFDSKGNYIGDKIPSMTPSQLKELEEINPEAAKEYKRNPKAYMSRMMKMYMGGAVKKKKMALGGMMDDKKINPSTGLSMNMGGLGRKVNPSTGLSMNKGGMTDYRKSGMFYGGGMARKR